MSLGEFTRTVTNLIKAIREVQVRLDQTPKNEYVPIFNNSLKKNLFFPVMLVFNH